MMSKSIYSPLSPSTGGSLFDEGAKTGCKTSNKHGMIRNRRFCVNEHVEESHE